MPQPETPAIALDIIFTSAHLPPRAATANVAAILGWEGQLEFGRSKVYARSYIRRIIVNYVANSDRSTRALLFGNYRKQKKRRERRISEPKSNFVSLQSLRKFMRFERSIVRNHRFLVTSEFSRQNCKRSIQPMTMK